MAKKAKAKKGNKNRLLLDDYKKCLNLASDTDDETLVHKLEKKIEQLENPPERHPREKTGFECVKCKHKFKQVRNHCPTCDHEKLKVIKLTEFL